MAGYWISFVVLFPVILFNVAYAKYAVAKRVKLSPEADKAANVRVVFLILFYWLCNLFYMACFIDNLICKFIFGGLILLIVFMNLAKAFTYPSVKSGMERLGLLQDFIVGIGLTIYLIYIIPNNELKAVVIPIVAAVYGGLLTLVGVAWTIRKAEKDKKEEEKNKAKPIFTYNPLYEREKDIRGKKVCFDDYDVLIKEEQLIKVFPCCMFAQIENSDRSVFSIEKVYHDKKWWGVSGNKVILPGSSVYFEMNFCGFPEQIFMEIQDGIGNKYYYQIKVLLLSLLPHMPFHDGQQMCHTIRELKEVSQEEMLKAMQEENNA